MPLMLKQAGSCEKHREKPVANELRFPKWQQPYPEALMETDEQKLVKRVKLAESAISNCSAGPRICVSFMC
jgi:hypothetical protein